MEFQKYDVKEKKKKKKKKKWKEEGKEREKKRTKKNKQGHEKYKENTGTKLITNTKKQKLTSRIAFSISKIRC